MAPAGDRQSSLNGQEGGLNSGGEDEELSRRKRVVEMKWSLHGLLFPFLLSVQIKHILTNIQGSHIRGNPGPFI